jgi:hypothetical protein
MVQLLRHICTFAKLSIIDFSQRIVCNLNVFQIFFVLKSDRVKQINAYMFCSIGRTWRREEYAGQPGRCKKFLKLRVFTIPCQLKLR